MAQGRGSIGTPAVRRCITLVRITRTLPILLCDEYTGPLLDGDTQTPSLSDPQLGKEVFMRTELYFAYGSNLCLTRIRQRAPSAIPFSIGCIHGYRLLFHKRSVDGSGKCTIAFSGQEEDFVFGFLLRVNLAFVASCFSYWIASSFVDAGSISVRFQSGVAKFRVISISTGRSRVFVISIFHVLISSQPAMFRLRSNL